MSATTSIEWTDKTWNPTTGCDQISPGCAHCYAKTIAERLWASQYPEEVIFDEHRQYAGQRPRVFTDVRTHEDRLLEPLSWRKPARVFVNSMSDLFHEDVPDAFIDRVFAVMARCAMPYRDGHTFQVLTKRPERMRAYMAEGRAAHVAIHAPLMRTWPLPNVWLGVSVENQHFADERIPLLLQPPAAVHFISAEPLLGKVELFQFLPGGAWLHSPREMHSPLSWVIVGGESGPQSRPFDLAWARAIVAQCKAASVPVFVKQLGAHAFEGEPENDGHGPQYFTKNRKGGDMAEWPDDLRVREFPRACQAAVQ